MSKIDGSRLISWRHVLLATLAIAVLHYLTIRWLSWRMLGELDVPDDGPTPDYYRYEKVLLVIGGPLVWIRMSLDSIKNSLIQITALVLNSLIVGLMISCPMALIDRWLKQR